MQKTADVEFKKDSDFTWKIFEETGMIGAYLVYHETQKNIEALKRIKSLLAEFEEN
jgi:hypothetical protein